MKEKGKTRSELKHEAILDAAKRAFLAYGVQGTSMDKLAEMADVSKRTVYNHFSTKEELVLRMLSDLWTRAMVEPDIPYAADRPLQDQLLRFIEDEIELVSGEEFLGLSRAAAGHYLFEPDKLQDVIARFQNDETALHRWLRSAMADGRMRKADVGTAFDQLHSLIKGACYWPQLLGFKSSLTAEEKRRLADATVAMFLDHYEVRD